MTNKTLLSWSSGKDSAWALHILRQDPSIEVVGLLSVLNERYERVSMHSTRTELLDRQTEATGLPLHTVRVPDPCSNQQYDTAMEKAVNGAAAKGITLIAFGDLYLEDVRRYREQRLADTGIGTLFPLWRIPTPTLAERMFTAGIEAYISCVDLNKLPASFAGRRWSQALLKELPPGVDPCGENGEFHTIVVDGPMFKRRIDVEIGTIEQRNGFAYADILPVS